MSEKTQYQLWLALITFVVWIVVCNVMDFLDAQDWRLFNGKFITLLLVGYWVKNISSKDDDQP